MWFTRPPSPDDGGGGQWHPRLHDENPGRNRETTEISGRKSFTMQSSRSERRKRGGSNQKQPWLPTANVIILHVAVLLCAATTLSGKEE